MTVVFEGFSIRDYASKMRSVDVSKCWPFEKEDEKNNNKKKKMKEIETLLPPITCKKYRWWGNELEAVKSTTVDEKGTRKPVLQVTIPLTEKQTGFDKEIPPIEKQQGDMVTEKPDLGIEKAVLEDKMVLICPVCQIFTASTVNAVNVHIDSCLAEKVSREEDKRKLMSNAGGALKKSKILKKRSILEIFAVAPQIETVDVEDEDEDEEADLNTSKSKGVTIMRNLKLMKTKKKKKMNGSTAAADAKLNSKKERHQKRQNIGNADDPVCLSDMESDDVWIIEKEDPSLPQVQSCMDSYECIVVEDNRRKMKRGPQDYDDAFDPICLSDMESDELWIIEKENSSLPQDPVLVDIEGNFDDVEQVEKKEWKRKRGPRDLRTEKLGSGKGKGNVQELDLEEENIDQNAREKCRKPKVPVPGSSIARTKGLLLNKKLRRQITDDIAMLKKKPSSKKNLSKQNKLNVFQASKLVAKSQQQEPPVFPVPGILKNQTVVTSIRKPSDCLQVDDQTKLCLIQQSERHVSFSGKDDIIGPTKKCCSSLELPQTQCLQKVFSDAVDNALVSQLSEDSDEYFPKDDTPEVNGSEGDIVINIASEVGSTHGKELLDEENDHLSVSTFLSPNNNMCEDTGKGFSDESIDLTQASQHHHDFQLFSEGKSNPLYKHPYAGIPRLINSTKGGLNSNVEIQAGRYQEANDRGKILPDPFVNSLPRSAATSSFENIRAALQPSASSLTTSIEPNVRHHFLPRSSMHPSNDCSFEYQPFYHLSPKGQMSSISSSVKWKKQGTVIRRNNVIDYGFIGLPLNSQGELIQFPSSSKLGYNHLKKPDVMMSSSSTMPIHNLMWPNIMDQTNMKQKHHADGPTPGDNLKLFPGKNWFTQNPTPLPSRFGVTEMQGTRRTDVHSQDSLRGNNDSIHQLGSELNLMKLSCHGCRPCSLTLNQSENGKKPADNSECGFLSPNQPTMRLMGKDVTVGRSSNQEVQGFEDGGRIWTDKEIITEHYPTMSTAPVSANSRLYGHSQPEWVIHPVPQKANGVVTPSGAQTSTISPNFLQMRAVDPRSAHSYLDWQTYLLSQSGIPSVNRDKYKELQPFVSPLDSQLWMNKTSKVLESGISEAGCSKMGSETPVPVPAHSPHSSCDLRLFNSTQLKSKKSLDAQETVSSFMFPFSGQDCPDYVQPSWSQSSSYCLPQWLLSATLQQEASPTISQHYSDTSATYQSCSVSGAGFVPIHYPHHNSMISYSHNPSNSFPRVRSSSGSSSLGHPPLMPVPPGFRRTFPINTSCKKRVKVKDGTKCKDYSFNHLDYVKKARKRPAAIADDSARPFKKLNCEMHDSSSLMGFSSGANIDVCMQYNTLTPVLDAYRNNGSAVGFSPMEIQRDGLINSPVNVFPNVDIVGRSGPIKLSAGAKHILKPNQNIDQVDYRLTHSAVSVGAVTNPSKVSVFQKKPAQVYRF